MNKNELEKINLEIAALSSKKNAILRKEHDDKVLSIQNKFELEYINKFFLKKDRQYSFIIFKITKLVCIFPEIKIEVQEFELLQNCSSILTCDTKFEYFEYYMIDARPAKLEDIEKFKSKVNEHIHIRLNKFLK